MCQANDGDKGDPVSASPLQSDPEKNCTHSIAMEIKNRTDFDLNFEVTTKDGGAMSITVREMNSKSPIEEAPGADKVSATRSTSQPDTYEKQARELVADALDLGETETEAQLEARVNALVSDVAVALRSSVSEAVAVEREECAKIADDHSENWPCRACSGSEANDDCATVLANRIRSRGEAR